VHLVGFTIEIILQCIALRMSNTMILFKAPMCFISVINHMSNQVMHALLKHKPTPKMTPYTINILIIYKKFSRYSMCDKAETNQCIPTLIIKYVFCVIVRMYFPLLSIIFHLNMNMILTSNYHYLQIMTRKTKIKCPFLRLVLRRK